VGIPLLFLGRYQCNKSAERMMSYSPSVDGHLGVTCNSNDFLKWSDKPFQWLLGTACIAIAVTCLIIDITLFPKKHQNIGGTNSRENIKQDSRQQAGLDHDEILYMGNFYATKEILLLIENVVNIENQSKLQRRSKMDSTQCTETSSQRSHQVATYLNALALKCGKESTEQTVSSEKQKQIISLYVTSLQASYLTLHTFTHHDIAISSALSLLALISKSEMIRQKNLHEADQFGLDVPINSIRQALKRAKACPNPTEEQERISAELQRKGCLYLGALADGDQDIARKIVDEDGMIALIDILDWYRFHSDVVNWTLWAIFILGYEHVINKREFVRLGGIDKVCRAMDEILKLDDDDDDSMNDGTYENESRDAKLEVARHGIAILFDTLRISEESDTNIMSPTVSMTNMKIALNAGMQQVVKNAMVQFPQSPEVVLMGQQMLIATGYVGEIPTFEGQRTGGNNSYQNITQIS
jgi:hypothetical protein